MVLNQKLINFQIPQDVLEKLRQQSRTTGISVSALIKIAIAEKYFQEEETQKS